MRQLNQLIYIILIFTFTIYASEPISKPKSLIFDQSLSKYQIKKMILAAKRYAAFWNTGREKFAKRALADNFMDLNLPKGRKQGIEGALNASKWFRTVVPDLRASIEEMIIIKNKVILRLQFTGHFTGKFHNEIGKGQKINFSAVDIYTIKNGKIETNWHLEDNEVLMKQLNKYVSSKKIRLYSNDIKEGNIINPNQYWNEFGCSGKNKSPKLFWEGIPKNAKSLAITFYDKDAPTGSGIWHWTAYNIPVNMKSINPNSVPKNVVDANTDMGKPGYFGPCPPIGRVHNYTFTLHVLNVEKLTPPKGATSALVRFFINKHTIDKATFSIVAGPRK